MLVIPHNNDEVYVVPASYRSREHHTESNTRGSVFGLTRGTTKEDFIRALFNPYAYQVGISLIRCKVDASKTAIQVP